MIISTSRCSHRLPEFFVTSFQLFILHTHADVCVVLFCCSLSVSVTFVLSSFLCGSVSLSVSVSISVSAPLRLYVSLFSYDHSYVFTCYVCRHASIGLTQSRQSPVNVSPILPFVSCGFPLHLFVAVVHSFVDVLGYLFCFSS